MDTTNTGIEHTDQPDRRQRPATLTREARRFGVPGAWLVLAVVFAVAAPDRFLTYDTFLSIFGTQQVLVFLALALTCTLTAGDINLSIVVTLAGAATVVRVLVANGYSVVVAALLAVLASGVVGVMNGLLVVVLKVDSALATLATGAVVLSCVLSLRPTASALPAGFTRAFTSPVLGLPLSFYYGLVLTLIAAYVFGLTPTGWAARFVRSNREVARLAGVRVDRLRFTGFLFSGLICGLGGLVATASTSGYDPGRTGPDLVAALAVTMLGGLTIHFGHVNPIGGWLAVHLLATGIVGLDLPADQPWAQYMYYGTVLVVVLTVHVLVRPPRPP